jgi:hypothetical protein
MHSAPQMAGTVPERCQALAGRLKCHAQGAKRLDPWCVEQTLSAFREVALAVWERFRTEQPDHA